MEKIITDYEFQLDEPPCAPGVAVYSVQIILPDDISAVFPYLNAVLEETLYDQENCILIGSEGDRRFAFRAREIKVAGVTNYEEAQQLAGEVVNKVNSVWQERDDITPCFSERKLPTVIDIFRVLPKTNCKECGYMTCLAYAADLRDGAAVLEQCPALSQPEYAENRDSLLALFSRDKTAQKSR
jgi:ArsR family metal-binding transcriptional regulator